MSASRKSTAAPARRGVLTWIARFLRDHGAAVSPLMALSLVPIVGALGMGVEGSNWWLTQRAVQNAADSAAMSASWNGSESPAGTGSATSYDTTGCATTPSAFDCEAVAAAQQAGYANGSNNVVVFPQRLSSGCPGGLATCYEVTITKTLPVYLLGFALKSSTQNVQAIAFAGVEANQTAPDCLFALGKHAIKSGDAFHVDGGPKANLGGCDIQIGAVGSPAADADCNGHDLGADAAFATGSVAGCGKTRLSTAEAVADPYASLANNIPPDTCGGLPANYAQETSGPLPASNIIGNGSGSGKNATVAQITWPATKSFCGDVQLSSAIEIESNTTLVIYNGELDLNGMANPSKTSTGAAIQTDSGASLTIVFAGSNTVGTGASQITPQHVFTTNGLLDISSPQSGAWSGVAIYQAPNLTSNVNLTSKGNSTFFDLSGIIYQPNAADTFSGAIGKSTNGFSCFIWVFDSMLINGTSSIFQGTQSQCNQQGATEVFSSTPVHKLIG